MLFRSLKYLPHPHPYFIQWLSESGEMKVNHMVQVEFQIGPYKDILEFDVVPMTVCHLLLGRLWQFDRDVRTMKEQIHISSIGMSRR